MPFWLWLCKWSAYNEPNSKLLLLQGGDRRYTGKIEAGECFTYVSPRSRRYLQKALRDDIDSWFKAKGFKNRVTFKDRKSTLYVSLLKSALETGEVNIVVVGSELIAIVNKNGFEMVRNTSFNFAEMAGELYRSPSLFNCSP